MKIMGILNITPDSFSDGGFNYEVSNALKSLMDMVCDGVDYIDIGAESSRPGSKRVDSQTQISRIEPLLGNIKKERFFNKRISIDTYLPRVAKYFLDMGVHMINDITGFENSELIDICYSYNCEVTIMHMLGNPETMQNNPKYIDVVDEVSSFLVERMDKCVKKGVKHDKIWVDPGIGFGKNFDDNIRLFENIDLIKKRVGAKVLLGASRKSFINSCLTKKAEASMRDPGTIATTVYALLKGVDMVRVHNVSENKQALEVFSKISRIAV